MEREEGEILDIHISMDLSETLANWISPQLVLYRYIPGERGERRERRIPRTVLLRVIGAIKGRHSLQFLFRTFSHHAQSHFTACCFPTSDHISYTQRGVFARLFPSAHSASEDTFSSCAEGRAGVNNLEGFVNGVIGAHILLCRFLGAIVYSAL